MPLSDRSRVKAKPDVLSRILDGEAVILDLESGTYYGLNDTGSDVWALISEGATIKELRDRISDLYEVDDETVQNDVETLVDELHRRGLVDVT